MTEERLELKAQSLHRQAFIFDACVPGTGIYRDEVGEIKALVTGGVNAVNITVAEHSHNFTRAIENISRLKRLIDRHQDKLMLCTTISDLKSAKESGRVGVVIHFQDSKPIEDNLDYLRIFYELGLRVLQLTYNLQAYAGAGCCERSDGGLTWFGLDLVAECNRLGILIDLSHCGYRTAMEAISVSKAPVAFTHVGAYAVCPAKGRNKPDELLKALADRGGIIGVTFFPPLVRREPGTHRVVQATLDDVLDHIDHLVRVVGIDHVGFGSDLSDYYARTLEMPPTSALRSYRSMRPDVYGQGPTDRYDPFPVGLDSHAKLTNLTAGLLRRGYSEEAVMKILGGNWLRLLGQVWHQ